MTEKNEDFQQIIQFAPPEFHNSLKIRLNQSIAGRLRPATAAFREALQSIEFLNEKNVQLSSHHGKVCLKTRESLVSEEINKLHACAKTLIPWRKGPFLWHNLQIDAEWLSSEKWERMQDIIDFIPGKKILDVGCNNGYYMLRAMEHHPHSILGIDPTSRFYFQWKMLTQGLCQKKLAFASIGIEDLTHFPNAFDIIFCLGILYHHPDPISRLKILHQTLRKGGKMVVEVQGIDHREEMALFPKKHYAKVPGIWFLPSMSCLENWLLRAGFKNVVHVSSVKTTSEEQRNTSWCPRPFETLIDFLDQKNNHLTIEGYPAPYRHMFIVEK